MHPAAQKTVERVLGIEWSYHLLDFSMRLAIVAHVKHGESLACNIDLPLSPEQRVTLKHAPMAVQWFPNQVKAAQEFLLDELTKETTQ